MRRFIPIIVLIVLIPLPGWCIPPCEFPHLTDTGIIPIPVSSNPGTLVLPDTLPDFFDNLWIAAYNEAKSLGIAEDTAQLKAYWAWQEFNVDPAVLEMTKPMLEAVSDFTNTKKPSNISPELNPKELEFRGNINSPNTDEAKQPWHPVTISNGSNLEKIKDDITEHRELIVQLSLKPEEILKLYQVSQNDINYYPMFIWLEKGILKLKHWVHNQNRATI